MGIFEGCMEKTADLVRAAAMAEQIQLFSYYDKEEKLVFFQKKIETEGHSPRGMHGYLDSLKEKIRSFSKEEEEQLEFLNRKLMENAKNAFKMQQQNSDK